MRLEGFFDRWAARRLGMAPENITLKIVASRLLKDRNLRFGPTGSPLGGRIDAHLEQIPDDELDALAVDGEQLLQEFDAAATTSSDSSEDARPFENAGT